MRTHIQLAVTIVLAGLCGLGAFWCEGGDKDEVVLSATRPLLLPDVPAYLVPSPRIDQWGGTVTVQYSATDADGPSVFMQQFHAPQLADFPQRPPFEEMDPERGELERLGYFAPWRCGDLGLSTLVTWESDPGPKAREEVLDELADLFERACANTSTVPTPTVELAEVDVPQVQTCTALERDGLIKVTAENQTSEAVNVRIWSDPNEETIQEDTLEPGETASWELDVREFAKGLEFSGESDPDRETDYVLGIGLNGRDHELVLTGPPVLPRQVGEFNDQNCIDF